jgi:hypothetical protein
MSETQLEINGVTYSGKDLDLICLGMSLKEESIIKLLEELRLKHLPWCGKQDCVKCEQTMGIEQAMIAITEGEK